ncbi:hypothetical protein V1478_012628 [Vespula squamosa]|uniref:Uncharacterized protein n=1 Tax=Vespula squamosa TaxID=30214 RepID=A0ABD2A8G9_VESSQ
MSKMKGKGRRERRQASLRTIDVSGKDQRNRRSKWYAKASCRGGLIRIADWRMRGGPSIRNARMRRMIHPRVLHVTEKNTKENEEPESVSPGCSQDVLKIQENPKTHINVSFRKDLFTDENCLDFIIQESKESFEEKDNTE